MRFSVVTTVAGLYMVCIALYVFTDVKCDDVYSSRCMFWTNYFWLVNGLFSLSGYIFKLFSKNETPFEQATIIYLFLLRSILIIYFIIGLVFATPEWMTDNIVFICSCILSSFGALVFMCKKLWKRIV